MSDKHQKKISIVGGGVIGLSTGVLLLKEGYEVEIFAEKISPNTNSDKACAIWYPIFSDIAEDRIPLYNDIVKKSWEYFKKLEPDEKFGIILRQNHELFPTKEPLPYYIDILPDFEVVYNTSFPNNLPCQWSFKTYIIEMQKYMPTLYELYDKSGGKITERKIQSADEFTQLETEIIFNCTGFGSKELFNDEKLKPIKGQILLHEKIDLEFCIGENEFCLIPRSDYTVLGCLYLEDENNDSTTAENTNKIWEKVVERLVENGAGNIDTSDIRLSKSKIRSVQAGVRPFRYGGIKLEVENLNGKTIIHNYGHGGAGITLSWGSCMKAIDLMKAH